MKAKEYYTKYHDRMLSTDHDTSLQAISDLIGDLSREFKTIADSRNVRWNRAAYGILKELNDKYNAIVSLFETKDGFSPIRPNGFKLYWEREMPQLKGRLDSEAVRPKSLGDVRAEIAAMRERCQTYSEDFAPKTQPLPDFTHHNTLSAPMMLKEVV